MTTVAKAEVYDVRRRTNDEVCEGQDLMEDDQALSVLLHVCISHNASLYRSGVRCSAIPTLDIVHTMYRQGFNYQCVPELYIVATPHIAVPLPLYMDSSTRILCLVR